MDDLAFMSPLASGHDAAAVHVVPGLQIAEKPHQVMRELRADGVAADLAAGVLAAGILGGGLPAAPLTSARLADVSVFWSRPDGWIISGAPDVMAERCRQLEAALLGTPHALTDVGGFGFEISGLRARQLLAKGTALDLHPRAFPPGHVTRTMLAGEIVMIHARAADCLDLYVDFSMAGYFWDWLRDAAREFHLGTSA